MKMHIDYIFGDLLSGRVVHPTVRRKRLCTTTTLHPVQRRERDTQRSKVYACDDILRKATQKLPEMADIERLVKKVFASKRVQEAFPAAMARGLPKVKDGRGRRRAGGNSSMITMPLWSRDEAIVLHELAHCFTQRIHGMKVAAHGWQYCSIYLKLVLYVLGRDKHDILKAAFKANRVRFTEPRAKRVLTEEQRAALRDRLAIARKQIAA